MQIVDKDGSQSVSTQNESKCLFIIQRISPQSILHQAEASSGAESLKEGDSVCRIGSLRPRRDSNSLSEDDLRLGLDNIIRAHRGKKILIQTPNDTFHVQIPSSFDSFQALQCDIVFSSL